MPDCECEKGLVLRDKLIDGVRHTQVLRCYCDLGKQYAGDYFLPADKKHERPFQMPMVEKPIVDRKMLAAGGDD